MRRSCRALTASSRTDNTAAAGNERPGTGRGGDSARIVKSSEKSRIQIVAVQHDRDLRTAAASEVTTSSKERPGVQRRSQRIAIVRVAVSGIRFDVAGLHRSPPIPMGAIEEPPLPRLGRAGAGRDVVGRRRRWRLRRVDVGRIEVVGPPVDPRARDAGGREGRSRTPPDCFVLEAFGEARVIELGGLGQGGRFVPTGEDLGDSFTGRERHRDTDWRGPGGARALGEAIAAVEVQH